VLSSIGGVQPPREVRLIGKGQEGDPAPPAAPPERPSERQQVHGYERIEQCPAREARTKSDPPCGLSHADEDNDLRITCGAPRVSVTRTHTMTSGSKVVP
jgi:hypothetical protein